MSMLNHFFDYKPEVLALDEKAMELCFLRTRSYRLLSNKGYKTTPTSGPPNCRSRKRKRR